MTDGPDAFAAEDSLPPDPLDAALSDLGQGAPFPIDWKRYENELLLRMARAETSRRRQLWFSALMGAAVGAAAMFIVCVRIFVNDPPVVAGPSAEPKQMSPAPWTAAPLAAADPAAPARPEFRVAHFENGGRAIYVESPAPDEAPVAPFTCNVRGKDGKVGTIRFSGYTDPDTPKTGMIAARRTAPADDE